MTGLRDGIGFAIAALALALTAPAWAQENLDSGKTGAQLFVSNCALCHKSAQALNKSGGLLGLSGFLREHYTASRESASAIASYLESVGNAPAPAKRKDTKHAAKGDEKAKLDEKKDKTKSEKSEKSEKSGEAVKSDEVKSSAPKSEPKSERKTEPKGDAKGESKSESKPPKTLEPKPDKPEKSD